MKIQNPSLIIIISLIFISCKKNNENIIGNSTDGEIVLSTYSANLSSASTMVVLDKYGNSIFERTVPNAAINFRKWTVNGKTRYTYMEYDPTVVQLTQGILPTTGVLLDENFREIKRLRLIPFNGRTTADPSAIDAHDLIYLDDNHFITLSYIQKVVTNIPASLNPVANCKVVAPTIQEILNDKVVWEWDGSNYADLYTQSVEGNAFSNANVVHDYIHMNSIYIDPTDNNLICSMRNLNQIIKISRTDGHIIWRLGGTNSDFPLSANMKFLRQHNVTLTDNNQTLLVYDNGHATERPYTRVLEFQLSTDTKSVSSFKAFTLPQNIFSQFMGSVQKRGDTYFISCGSVSKILEVNYVTGQVNFLLNMHDVSYRALKY
jgi:arylsulfate sulfotransferase